MAPRNFCQPLRRPPTIFVGIVAAVLSLWSNSSAQGPDPHKSMSLRSYGGGNTAVDPQVASYTAMGASPADPPSYLPWYASPSPLPSVSAYVGIGGAWGSGNIYNTATNAFPSQAPGTGVLDTGQCSFMCFGSPGRTSHHFFAYGNDVNPPSIMAPGTSYTHYGAAADCTPTPPGQGSCPGGVENQAFGATIQSSPQQQGPFFLAVDGTGNLGVLSDLYAGAAIIAGAGTSTPEPSPSTGSLVSYTGSGRGEILLGSTGALNFVKCDYGETTAHALTCNQKLIDSAGGIRPNGASGGYAPEAFPLGVATPHPLVMSGNCVGVSTTALCTFPNSFSFSDTSYNCTVSAIGTSGVTESYAKTSSSSITIYSSRISTFTYICMR